MKNKLFLFLAFISVSIFYACKNEDLLNSDSAKPLSARVAATTYYVSPSGLDSRTAAQAQSQSTPWKTLTYASQNVPAGSIIQLLPGTYTERAVISPNCNGTAGNPTIIKGNTSKTVIFDGQQATFGQIMVFNNYTLKLNAGCKYITIDGIFARNSECFGFLVDGAPTNKCTNIKIQNCTTFNTLASGIFVRNGSFIDIISNKIERACQYKDRVTSTGAFAPLTDLSKIGSQECITVAGTTDFKINANEVLGFVGPGNFEGSGGEGIDVKGASADGEVSNNYVHDLFEIGLYVDASSQPLTNVRVHRNKVYDTGGTRIACELVGGSLKNLYFYNNIIKNSSKASFWIQNVTSGATEVFENIYVVNNTFINNGTDAASSSSGDILCYLAPQTQAVRSKNWFIKNNIFYNKTGTAKFSIRIDHPKDNLQISNNLFFDFIPSVVGKYKLADLNADATSKVGNPLFVNLASNNFALQSTSSPAYNAGVVIR
jgi:hypothetical protein